jgi:hypothetical protein
MQREGKFHKKEKIIVSQQSAAGSRIKTGCGLLTADRIPYLSLYAQHPLSSRGRSAFFLVFS